MKYIPTPQGLLDLHAKVQRMMTLVEKGRIPIQRAEDLINAVIGGKEMVQRPEKSFGIWDTVDMGGVTIDTLIERVECVAHLCEPARKIITSPGFENHAVPEKVSLIALTHRELGYCRTLPHKFDSRFLKKWSRINLEEYQLEICAEGVGPYLVIGPEGVDDLTTGQSFVITSRGHAIHGGDPHVFVIRSEASRIYLDAVNYKEYIDTDDNVRYVFQLRKI